MKKVKRAIGIHEGDNQTDADTADGTREHNQVVVICIIRHTL